MANVYASRGPIFRREFLKLMKLFSIASLSGTLESSLRDCVFIEILCIV